MGSRGIEGAGDDVLVTFAADVARLVGAAGARQVMPVVERLRRPLRVGVLGRAGVGVRTVAAALIANGVPVVAGPDGDVTVLVVNDGLRDDEFAALAGRPHALVVLAKADLCGARPDGPMAAARGVAASIAEQTGVPTVPVAALLADVALTDGDAAALRTLTTCSADLSSVDAFVDGPHALDRAVRARLLERLDRFGIAHAVSALMRGELPSALPAILRSAANVDAVTAAVHGCLAAARHARVSDAVVELSCRTALSRDLQDAATFARMTAAVNVVEAAGLAVDRTDDVPAHERRAVHWRRYGRGPVSPLHRACSADIARGSLLLLGDAR